MKKLLSLPPNLVDCFHDITGSSRDEWFCTNDPIGQKLGSGGGTAWTVQEARRSGFITEGERCIIVHAGGQSRRLPAYAPSGKILTPIPVFRWKRGQKLSQNLLDLQLPLYESIMQKAPERLRTMIVSGDVLIRANQQLQEIPDADVVCYGLWVQPSLAKNHGVFVSRRQTPDVLEYMLQKPTVETLGSLMKDHLFLMDIGVWLLSDKALDLLMKRSAPTPESNGYPATYDLYSEFGLTLGKNPKIADPELNQLSVAILPLPGGEFHHYGTSPEMISSTLAIQNIVKDQRFIMKHGVKPHPSMFVQNSVCLTPLSDRNQNTWIENSYICEGWQLMGSNIVTGMPHADKPLRLPEGMCLDIVPIGEKEWAVRLYEIDDPHPDWLLKSLGFKDCSNPQVNARIYPVVDSVEKVVEVADWLINELGSAKVWNESRKMSAEELSAYANLRRLEAQRQELRAQNWPALAANSDNSVFYQLDLANAAEEFVKHGIDEPKPLPDTTEPLKQISDAMFRARLASLRNNGQQDIAKAAYNEARAFSLMREGLTATAHDAQMPRLNVYADQIVWSRSPVRIDLAGGWTDTPPYSLMEGGNVVNIAIELNGQPPLQVYCKPCSEHHIILRSIDLGAAEKVETYEQLAAVNKVGSPFSIPKAALVLAGFHPDFCAQKYDSLQQQLADFGSGIEMTMLSAIPAGSGLGTSSILASTVLGAVNEFCGLGWDRYEISNRTLVLEQLLTTGGGWQDQYGGVMQGVKLLQTQPGWHQQPLVRWLPDTLFTAPEYQKLHLLYYTGITRTAKGILAEIVRGMFLNSGQHLSLLAEMKQHALDLYDAIQRGNFEQMGRLVAKTWQQNQALDSGTNPDGVKAITRQIDDLCLGYKLPGAGGGGYLYMVAKDEEAAARIKKTLNGNPLNDKARFVDMTLSSKGLEISKS
ncbi:MAG: bifunctional fucokinase/L-fucose-1-P-guanylyltransferase [Bacteroidales bacterium]|nr:bifunctional fucokinase/L-fucose-1-P-guanylyltransferase [Candidatus Liminaster caballi]